MKLDDLIVILMIVPGLGIGLCICWSKALYDIEMDTPAVHSVQEAIGRRIKNMCKATMLVAKEIVSITWSLVMLLCFALLSPAICLYYVMCPCLTMKYACDEDGHESGEVTTVQIDNE